MFCPQCGHALPDDARFCGSCGAKMPDRPAPEPVSYGSGYASTGPAAQPAQVGVGAGPKVRGTGFSIPLKGFEKTTPNYALLGAIIVALIFSLLPWYQTSPEAVQMSGYAANISEFTAEYLGTSTLPRFSESYSVFSFPALGSQVDSYRDVADELEEYASSLSSSSNDSGSRRSHVVTLENPEYKPLPATLTLGFVFFCWIAAIIFLIMGAFSTEKRIKWWRWGMVLLIVAVIAFFGAYGALGDVATGFPANALICLIAAIIGLIASYVVAPRKAKA